MYLLSDGKGPFLEFLRNLTPQVLLGSVAMATYVRLDFGRVDLSNWVTTATFFLSTIVTILAFIANMSAFMDAGLSAVDPFQRVGRRLRLRGHPDHAVIRGMTSVIWRRQPSIYVGLLVLGLTIYGAMFAALHQVVIGAQAILKAA